MRSPKAIRAALKSLPSGSNGYDKAYKDAMNRIEGQVAGQEELAKQVLSWIICAEKPLTTLELQHALAVEVGESELDEDNLPEVEDMVSVCAGLVTIDEESDIIRLVHYTTQEYFERTQSYWFPVAQADITIICVTYLSFDVFESGFCRTNDEFEERLRSNKFLEYAARNWGHHARKARTLSQALKRAALSFLLSESKVNTSSQVLFTTKYSLHNVDYGRSIPRRVTGLHLTVHFGCETTAKLLLEVGKFDANSRDTNGQTPLFWAATKGHEAIVKLLLETGEVNIDSKDSYGQTPLLEAAKNGHEASVKLLLETSIVDANSKDNFGWTPLWQAAGNGYEAIVKLLLETGKVDADSRDKYGQTPLSEAAKNGHEAIVKLLLETGIVDADSKDNYGQTPLYQATWKGYIAVVKLLLETSIVDTDSKDNKGQTPLFWAATNGHEAIVKLLLETGKVDIDAKDDYGQTPLSEAAKNGHEAIFKLLLETSKVKADLNSIYSQTTLL
jgi:ankyrin repeat protein